MRLKLNAISLVTFNAISLVTSGTSLLMKGVCGCLEPSIIRCVTVVPTELSTEWASNNAWNCRAECVRIPTAKPRHPQVF